MGKENENPPARSGGKNRSKIEFGGGLGFHLGKVWEGLQRLLGALRRLLPCFEAFKLVSFSSVGPRWAPRGLLDRFWIDFDRVLVRFWAGLGRHLLGFGS